MGLRRLYAFLNLAAAFWLHWLRKLAFWKEDRGIERFFKNYAEDNITSLTAGEAAFLERFEGCIACGACAGRCEALAEARYRDFMGPREIAACLSRSLPELWAARDTVYRCLLCSSCEVVCPQGVPVSEIASFARRKVRVQDENHPPSERLARYAENVRETGHLFGEPPPWPGELERERADVVLFAGCVTLSRNPGAAEAALALLEKEGLRATPVKERCCGEPVVEIGGQEDDGGPRDLLERCREKGARRVATLCPHCRDRLSASPALKGEGIEVRHLAEVLAAAPSAETGKKKPLVFYLDPCRLARGAGIVEAPRRLLAGAFELVETPRSGVLGECCGAGGAVKSVDAKISDALGKKRLEEARRAGAALVVTACPACHSHLTAVEAGQSAEGFPQVADLAEALREGSGVIRRGDRSS